MEKQNKTYPEIIEGDKSEGYEIIHIDKGTYKEDYEEALKYVKENGGAVYTIIDGWGSSVDYFKGVCSCDRLGVCVLLHNTQLKRGSKRVGYKDSRLNGCLPHQSFKSCKGVLRE